MAKELSQRIKLVAEYYLTHPTLKQAEIAKQFNLSIGRISQILSSPRVTSFYPLLARRRVQSHLLPKALKRYERIIEHSANDAVAEKAAGRVLASENVFDGPKITIQNDITIKTVMELQQIVNKAAATGLQDVIEGEIIPDTVQDTTHPDVG